MYSKVLDMIYESYAEINEPLDDSNLHLLEKNISIIIQFKYINY